MARARRSETEVSISFEHPLIINHLSAILTVTSRESLIDRAGSAQLRTVLNFI